ncbi:hypothetical protein CLOHAE12215_01325 [Clostridium haemolyticum]|uniref:hypothetical protein n=1 Tax=Clostridium haemolyticum TaxID=84025 RepID=UPI001C3AA62D|nr:hypothetical protein [Clostridium haemolyticum]CAG7839909.1 hypothetical protein CLOHAE12215_01325 [Clostridium haemolyticum]
MKNSIKCKNGEYGEIEIVISELNGDAVIRIANWRKYNKTAIIPASCDFQLSITNGSGLGNGCHSATLEQLFEEVSRCIWVDKEDIQLLKEIIENLETH